MNLCAIGTGAITKSMLAEFKRSDVLHCTAIYSRKEETGRAMAEEFGLEKVFTSMEEMLADASIDMVYVASPNSIHYSQTKAALLAGKHVICEKPCTTTESQTRELFALAKERNLFLMEAQKMLFLPAVLAPVLSLLVLFLLAVLVSYFPLVLLLLMHSFFQKQFSSN